MVSKCSSSQHLFSEDESEIHADAETIRSLQCLLCECFMKSAIMQCRLGHNYCKDCYEELWCCSKCSAQGPFTRNCELEKLYFRVKLPCENTNYGCAFTARPEEMKFHQQICSFKPRLCPFNFYCDWTGQLCDIQGHCEEDHSYNTCVNSVNTKFFFLFKRQYQGLIIFVVFVYDCMFRVTFNLDLKTKSLQCAIYYIGDKKEKRDFWYEVRFLKKDTEETGYTFKSDCFFLENEKDTFVDKQFLAAPLSVLHELCDGNGNLHYVISITEKIESLCTTKQLADSSKSRCRLFKYLEKFF